MGAVQSVQGFNSFTELPITKRGAGSLQCKRKTQPIPGWNCQDDNQDNADDERVGANAGSRQRCHEQWPTLKRSLR
jgi:hypothetical protein